MDASDELLRKHDPAALLTLDGVISDLNAAMASVLDRPAEQCLGCRFGDLLPASQRMSAESLVGHAVRAKTVAMRVLDFPGPGRASVACLIEARQVKDAATGEHLVWVHSLDARNDLTSLLIPFRMATTAGDLGLWMYSSREHSLEWLGGAPAVADLFPDPTAPLSRVMPSVHPDDRGALQQLVSSVSARSPWTRLRYLTEHDGWHELAAQTLRIQLGYGGPERIFGVVRDDTKYEKRKKRARAALAADEDGTVTDGADTEAIGSPTVAPSTTYPTTYSDWQNGLLAGNGKQGVIVFGNPRNDTVVFEGVTRIVTDGTKTLSNGQVTVSNASYVLLLSLTQRYNGTYNGGVPAEQEWNKNLLQQKLAGLSTNYQTLLNRHVAKHSAIFNRVSFDLGATPADRAKSTEQLLAEQKSSSTPVPALYERMFYAGRYHLLGSSNETAAPDLLGNWTGDSNVGWDGYYHLDANLNLQISSGNIGSMPEAMAGYFWLNQQWQKDFETNAKKLFGTRGMLTGGNTPNAEGLISNINYDYPYQYVTGGESWLLYPFWEYYETTGDRTRAKRVRRSSEPLHH